MGSWGLVTTVKAPEEQILAFVAHHLGLGASRLWLYFDDPDDPAFERVAKLPRVTATRCTDWYWAMRGGRHEQHQNRQARNARHTQRKCKLDWLGHIDVDEFLHAARPVSEILGAIPPDIPNVLMESFEAMHTPDLPDDIFTARHFRGPLHRQHRDLHSAIFGPAAVALPKGSLAHAIGKSFCRPAVKGLAIRLHEVFLNKERLRSQFHPELRVLHFHAQDPVAWRRALPFRLVSGAYHHPIERPLQAFLTDASDEVIDQFYEAAMTLTPEKIDLLMAHDRLVTANLTLRAKVQDLLAGRLG
ncbi:glycosyltransferase family 2 protein [Tabrizicola sp.]|uniref:glycosyltransferase family 2 protein n=1 Tax=Tabrizicola sp. TaxID=2005166 RepID=UPI003452DD30